MTSVDHALLVAVLAAAIIVVMATIIVLARRRWAPAQRTYLIASDTGVVPPTLLRDWEHGLVGRPDYLVCQYDEATRHRRYVPREVKPNRTSRQLYESDELQLVAYLLCVRATYGAEAADYGVVEYKTTAFRVELTAERVARCLRAVEGIRAGRRAAHVRRSHSARPRCIACGVREACGAERLA